MGTLNFPGLATGIDTTQIVQQLVAIKGRPLANYQVKQNGLQEKQTALGELKTKVSQFQSAAEALADADALEVFSTSSSDTSRLGVGASSEAKPGSHSVLIDQLATSETWLQDTSTFDYDTEYVGAGNFIYAYNYKERVITTDATTTLKDFVNLINNDEDNPGVTASLLHQGDKYHLMLSGHDTGEDYQITVNSTSTEVWKPDSSAANPTFTDSNGNATLDTKLVDLTQWSGSHTGAETITITGKNNAGTTILPSRTLTISSDTTLNHLVKEINYYFEGFATARLDNGQIVLTDHSSGASSMEISLSFSANGGGTLGLPTMAVSTEGGSTSASISTLGSSTFVQTQNAQNAKVKIDNYSPTATAEVQTLTPDVAATGGTFTLTYGSQTTSALAYNASTTDIQNALNALSGISSIGNVTVAGTTLDGGGPFTVTFASSAGNTSMLSIDTGSLTGPSAVTVSETTRGNNESWISRNSNIITDAVTGLAFNLMDVNDTDATTGDPIPVEITISRNTSAVAGKVSKLASTYNSLLDELKKQTEYNESTKRMGILSNDLSVSLIKSQMRDPFTGVVDGFSGSDAYDEATDIGLSFDGLGHLKVDSSKLKDALEDNFKDTINLLGAQALGNTDSSTIAFNRSSARYTQAGTYDVQVTVSGGAVTSASIKLQSESTYRTMSIDSNLILGNSTFTDDGLDPVYPENGLYLQVDTSSDGSFTTTLRVKEGLAGTLNRTMDDITKANGRLDVSKNTLTDRYNYLADLIKEEQARVDQYEQHMVEKFARLERSLQEMQQQLSAVNIVSASVFGG